MARKGPYHTHTEALAAAKEGEVVKRDRLWWVLTKKEAAPKAAEAEPVQDTGKE